MKTQPETKPDTTPSIPTNTTEEKSSEAVTSAPASSSPSPVPQKIWNDLHDNLTQALGRWEHLSHKAEEQTSHEADHKISPEEQQLQEVKRLLDELKNKLREFSR